MAPKPNPNDPIGDTEDLYRRVRSDCWAVQDGRYVVLAGAFADRYRRPSVDRAALCSPSDSQVDERDGVAVLVASSVRETTLERKDNKRRHVCFISLDVLPDPILGITNMRDNPAHARIVILGECTKNFWRSRVRLELAYLANQQPWAVQPEREVG